MDPICSSPRTRADAVKPIPAAWAPVQRALDTPCQRVDLPCPPPQASSSPQQGPDSGHQSQVHAGKGGPLGGEPCQGVSSAAARGCRLLHYSGTMISLFLFWFRCGSNSPGLISKNGNLGDGSVPVSRLGTPGWVLAKVCRNGTNLGRWFFCECAGRSMGSWSGRAPKVRCKCCGR